MGGIATVWLLPLVMAADGDYVNHSLDFTNWVAGLRPGIVVPDSACMNPMGALTLEAWISPCEVTTGNDSLGGAHKIIEKWVGIGIDERCFLLTMVDAHLRFAVNLDGTLEGTRGVTSQAAINAVQWTHVAGVYDGSTLSLYIDGQREPNTVSVTGTLYAGETLVKVGGCGGEGMGASGAFLGRIDEVRISDVARYSGSFPRPAAEFAPDENTFLLMHMNEGEGLFTANTGNLGPSEVSRGAGRIWATGVPIVPEPACLGLMALGGVAVVRRRARFVCGAHG